MSVYTQEHTVKSAEASPYRLLRPSALQDLLQEVSVAHCEELDVGMARTMDRGILWVLLMQDTQILRMPAYKERITVSTWPGKTHHMLFPRYYEVCGDDGTPLVRASALWTLICADTRRIASPEQYGIVVCEETGRPAWALPESVCCAQTEETFPFTVPYSFLDMNGHMSSVRYLDLAEDHIAQAESGRVPVRIGAEYISELTQGEEISLELGRDGPVTTLQGRSGDKVYFKLRMEYESQ